MQPLYQKGGDDTPKISLDKDKGDFSITGKCFPDDPFMVFQPVFDWFEEYMTSPNNQTTIELNFTYINTASSKQITDLLSILQEQGKNKNIKIKWFYDKMDDDMEFEGEMLKSTLPNLEFSLIEL